MTSRRMHDDGPALGFVVGDSLPVEGATIVRKPAKSTAEVVDGAITFDVPGLYRFKRAVGTSYFEAVVVSLVALPRFAHQSGVVPRDPRLAVRSLALEPRATEALIARTIEADPLVDRPDNGQPGGALPFDF